MRRHGVAREGRAGGRGGAFRRGFRQRSPLVLVVAAALALLVLPALSWFVFDCGGLTVVSQGRLLRITHDDYVHVSYRIAQLKHHPVKEPVVYLFGGSGAMESIVSEGSLAREIKGDGGAEVSVVSLAAHAQTFAQTLALIDNLPAVHAAGDGYTGKRPVLLLIGLAPMRFRPSPEDDSRLVSGRPMLIRSRRIDELAPQLYGRKPSILGSLPGVLDYGVAYVRARLRMGMLPGMSLTYQHHYYPQGSDGASPLAKRLHVRDEQRQDRERYAKYGAYNVEVLEDILKLARERGYSVAFFDQPLNTNAGGPTWGGVVPKYRKQARRLAREYDVPYFYLDKRAKLRDADFADLYHLLSGEGRVRFQAQLARVLAKLIPAG